MSQLYERFSRKLKPSSPLFEGKRGVDLKIQMKRLSLKFKLNGIIHIQTCLLFSAHQIRKLSHSFLENSDTELSRQICTVSGVNVNIVNDHRSFVTNWSHELLATHSNVCGHHEWGSPFTLFHQ